MTVLPCGQHVGGSFRKAHIPKNFFRRVEIPCRVCLAIRLAAAQVGVEENKQSPKGPVDKFQLSFFHPVDSLCFPLLCTSVTLELGPEEEHTVEIKRREPRKLAIQIRWDADGHLCGERRKPRTIFPNPEITTQDSAPYKSAPFSIFAAAFPLKDTVSLYCVERSFAHAPAGGCLFLVSVDQRKGPSQPPIICLRV